MPVSQICAYSQSISEELLTEIDNLLNSIDDQEIFAKNVQKIINFLNQDTEKNNKKNNKTNTHK